MNIVIFACFYVIFENAILRLNVMLLKGCAKMTSRIGGYIGGGNWKSAHGTAHFGRNFSMQWLKVQFSC
jgi:hypothetical protein